MANVKCSKSVKLTEEDFKQLLEETYKEWNTAETDDYGDSLNWQALLVIEEMYETIFGQEEFNEFIKRKEEAQKSFNHLKYHMGLLGGLSGSIEDCLL